MDWYRRYTEGAMHPQLRKAGFLGGVVFTALCDISARFDLGGVIPPAYFEGAYLENWLMLDRETGETRDRFDVTAAVARLIHVGLCRMENEHLIIDGWDRKQTYAPDKSTERVRKFRERQRETEVKRDETVEEKRREEKREETTTPPAPPSGNMGGALSLDLGTLDVVMKPTLVPVQPKKPTVNGSRFVALRDRLVATYERIKKQKYGFDGAKDAAAVKRLLGMAGVSDDEIDRRWVNSLTDKFGAHGIAAFAVSFNRWGGTSVGRAVDVTRGTVPAESQLDKYGGEGVF